MPSEAINPGTGSDIAADAANVSAPPPMKVRLPIAALGYTTGPDIQFIAGEDPAPYPTRAQAEAEAREGSADPATGSERLPAEAALEPGDAAPVTAATAFAGDPRDGVRTVDAHDIFSAGSIGTVDDRPGAAAPPVAAIETPASAFAAIEGIFGPDFSAESGQLGFHAAAEAVIPLGADGFSLG